MVLLTKMATIPSYFFVRYLPVVSHHYEGSCLHEQSFCFQGKQDLALSVHPFMWGNHHFTCLGKFFPNCNSIEKKCFPYACSVFWHMTSNDPKWPHGLMCPGVKQGCPRQPLTPGSFIRLCSRRGCIDKGHRKGQSFSHFSCIQLKHQGLNQCLVFIGTLIVLIDWHVVELNVFSVLRHTMPWLLSAWL